MFNEKVHNFTKTSYLIHRVSEVGAANSGDSGKRRREAWCVCLSVSELNAPNAVVAESTANFNRNANLFGNLPLKMQR